MQDRELDIWQDEGVIDELDAVVKSGDRLDLILAQIPALFGTSEKATYLGFRAVGLTPKQAMEVLGLTEYHLWYWYKDLPELEDFERNHLTALQSRVGADIVRLGFLRNMTMFLFKDQQVLKKSMSGMDEMSLRDFQYMKTIRRFYSTSDLLALQKAIQPEKHRDNVLVLNFQGQGYEIVEGDPEQMRYLEDGRQEIEVRDDDADGS